MKLYIVAKGLNKNNPNPGFTDDLYYLISEEGELIDHWISSNKYFAKKDLYIDNLENRRKCKEKFGDNIEIMYLGDDEMTDEELKRRNKEFCNS